MVGNLADPLQELEHLRDITRTLARMHCPKCGRQPILTRDGEELVLHVCPHTAPFFSIPPSCARLEVFDDGPARW